MTPACTLSIGESAASGRPASRSSTQLQVPGRICITPRAFASETTPLLNPLSCQATAAASDGDTPWLAATSPICEAVTRPGAGYGCAFGTTGATGAAGGRAASGAPVGSFSTVPIRSGSDGSSPFIQ